MSFADIANMAFLLVVVAIVTINFILFDHTTLKYFFRERVLVATIILNTTAAVVIQTRLKQVIVFESVTVAHGIYFILSYFNVEAHFCFCYNGRSFCVVLII